MARNIHIVVEVGEVGDVDYQKVETTMLATPPPFGQLCNSNFHDPTFVEGGVSADVSATVALRNADGSNGHAVVINWPYQEAHDVNCYEHGIPEMGASTSTKKGAGHSK